MTRATLAALSLVLPYLRPQVVRAGTIACLSSKSDWYAEAVGEAPYKTWETPYPSVAPTISPRDAGSSNTNDAAAATPLKQHSNLVAISTGTVAGVALIIVAVMCVLLFCMRRHGRARNTSPSASSQLGHAGKRARPPMIRTVISLAGATTNGSRASSDLHSPATSCLSAYDDPFSSSGLSSAGDCSTPRTGQAGTFARQAALLSGQKSSHGSVYSYTDLEEDITTASLSYYTSPKHLSPLPSPWSKASPWNTEEDGSMDASRYSGSISGKTRAGPQACPLPSPSHRQGEDREQLS